MRKYTLIPCIIIACMAFSGCDKQESQVTTTTSAEAAPSAEAPAASVGAVTGAQVGDGAVGTIASAFLMDGKGVLRYDRNIDPKTGKAQRQVFIEVLGGKAADAEAIAKAAVDGSEYFPGSFRADEKGVRMTFRSKSGTPIRLLARDKGVGPKLQSETATSSVYILQDP